MTPSSFLRLSAIATMGMLIAGCSNAQTSSSVTPVALAPAMARQLGASTFAPSQKCEHSPGFSVVPCQLTFSNPRRRLDSIFLHGAQGSGDTQEVDNCHKLATIGDFSGPAYLVKAKKAMGMCAAVFTHNGKFAILTINDEL
jgi:hypothetical protein